MIQTGLSSVSTRHGGTRLHPLGTILCAPDRRLLISPLTVLSDGGCVDVSPMNPAPDVPYPNLSSWRPFHRLRFVVAIATTTSSLGPALFLLWYVLYETVPVFNFYCRDITTPEVDGLLPPWLMWCSDFVVLHTPIAFTLFLALFVVDIAMQYAVRRNEAIFLVARGLGIVAIWCLCLVALSTIGMALFGLVTAVMLR